jgi:asparagine synthase (glutamine-hydrolysing)
VCGICGIHSASAAPGELSGDVARMNAAMVHRGPDQKGEFEAAGVAMAMRRLSIIDLQGGSQPIFNEAGTVCVVQNGEIYNFRELAEDLRRRGHTLATASDTEVLVHLYEEHGERFPALLRGMFAIAIWDAPAEKLVLARDPFGIKPLYYAEQDGALGFASELRSLLQWSGLSREIDPAALATYLTFNWIPAPQTILASARKLPPGHLLVHERGQTRVSRYSRPGAPAREQVRELAQEEAAELVRTALRDSVRAHLVADVPVGILLSGGVDSSILTALAAQETSKPLKTFSIGFAEKRFNELDKARLVAQRYGTDHQELVVSPDAADLLPKVANAFDEPFGDSSALPTYIVSELAASQVKVVLAGEGGDELFAGYFTYVAHGLAPPLKALAAAAWPALRRLPSGSGAGRYARYEDKLKRFARGASLPPLERHCAWQEVVPAEVRAELLPDGGASGDVLSAHRARFAETADADPLARFQDLDLGTYLVDDLLVKSDRASMAHSLEVRVPFVDPEVVRTAFSLATRHKIRGGDKKRVLKDAAAPLVPAEVLSAPKQGFSIPAADWLRGDLQPLAREALSDGKLAAGGLLDPGAARRLLDAHVAQRTDNSRQLWGLLMLTLWYESL